MTIVTGYFHHTSTVLIILLSSSLTHYSFADVKFNQSFMVGALAEENWNDPDKIITAGVYDVDVYVNNSWKGKFPVRIDEQGRTEINRSAISSLNLKVKSITSNDPDWIEVNSLLPEGKGVLDPGTLKLNINIPQAYVEKKAKNWIEPEQWDPGINGLYTNYNLSYYHTDRKDHISNTDNFYATLNSGFNLSSWHFIDKSVYRKNRIRNGRWSNTERYMERAIPQVHSFVRAGDTYTSSSTFDNIRFRGVSFRQDSRMYPDSYSIYMPVIRGVATSNAVIRVFQDNNLIYQMNVPPGPFAIDDLMPTGSRNDMTVVIENADGSRETQIIPYSIVAEMLRAGTSTWALNAGHVNVRYFDEEPDFAQGEYAYGINNYLTLYTGATVSKKYNSGLLGSAFSIPYVGSISVSAESARSKLKNDDTLQGQRYKISWGRYLPTRTNLMLSFSHNNSEDYISFYDSVRVNDTIRKNGDISLILRNKNTLSASLEQMLPQGYGRISLNGYWRSYWESQQKTKQYSLTWNNNYQNVSWSISASRVHYEYDDDYLDQYYDEDNYGRRTRDEDRIDLSITIPFNISRDQHASFTTRMSTVDGKYASTTAGVSVNTPRWDYSVGVTDNNQNNYRSANAYTAWRTPYTKLTGGYTESSNYRQAGAGASGSIVLWRKGLLTSPYTGNTFVIVDAPGVEDAIVNSNSVMKTNRNGQLLIPSVVAYRMNNIILDDNNTNNSAEIKGNIQKVVPWHGSIAYVNYQTDRRQNFVISAVKQNGEPLPFSSKIYDDNNEEVGYVVQGSQLYIRADQLPEKIHIKILNKDGKVTTCQIVNIKTEQENICQ